MTATRLACAALAIVTLTTIPNVAKADDSYRPDVTSSYPRYRLLGLQTDVGAPDGASLGLVIRPRNWLRTDIAVTNNGLAWGGRAGVTLDPFDAAVSPTLTVEGGFAGMGTVPGHATDVPAVGYDYANFHLGLDFGRRNYWRFFIHGGPSYVHAATGNFQGALNIDNGVTLANPTVNAWVVPTIKFGFAVYF